MINLDKKNQKKETCESCIYLKEGSVDDFYWYCRRRELTLHRKSGPCPRFRKKSKWVSV